MGNLSRLAIPFLALALSGCALLAPPYDPLVDQKTSGAYESVAKLVAKVELGSFADKATFPANADAYADVQAGLTIAAQRAETAPTAGKVAEKARGLLVGLIKGCSGQVASLADQHKRLGVPAGVGATQPVMVSCDQAAKAAQAMKYN